MSQVSLGRPEFVLGTPPGHPTAKFLYVIFLYRFLKHLVFLGKNRQEISANSEVNTAITNLIRRIIFKFGRVLWVVICYPLPQGLLGACLEDSKENSVKRRVFLYTEPLKTLEKQGKNAQEKARKSSQLKNKH